MEWDRTKQNYFILRRGNPWKVMDITGERFVANFPAYLYDNDLTHAICFAKCDEVVIQLLESNEKNNQWDGNV